MCHTHLCCCCAAQYCCLAVELCKQLLVSHGLELFTLQGGRMLLAHAADVCLQQQQQQQQQQGKQL
jgi:hypothetical protein